MARQNDGDWFSSDAPCSRTRCKLQPMPSCCHCSQNLQHSPARPTLGATVTCSQRYLVAACAFVCENETDALDNNLLLLKTLQCGACSARVVDGTMRMLLTLGIQSRHTLHEKTATTKKALTSSQPTSLCHLQFSNPQCGPCQDGPRLQISVRILEQTFSANAVSPGNC